MTILQEEVNILRRVRTDMYKAADKDGVIKLYRQARVWTRFHYYLAKACTYDKYTYLNRKFKSMRRDALRALK